MPSVYRFFFRLFLAFLTAKLVVRWFGWEGLGPLLGFTGLFLGNCYLFDFLDSWERTAWRRPWGRRPKTPGHPAGNPPVVD